MSETYTPVKLDKAWINKRLGKDPELQREYEARAEEYSLLDKLIQARNEAGLTQEQLAQRMGKHQSAVARLERTLSDPTASVSLTTLRQYAAACGKRLDIRFVD